MKATHSAFRIGASDRSNSAPLAYFAPQVCPDGEMIWDEPSTMAGRLLEGTLDMALIPIAALIRNPALMMVEPLGVCADGEVRSVLLKCRKPLECIRTVRTDKASQTSNALTAVLMKHHFKKEVLMGNELVSADAEVMIADRAMCAEPAEGGDYDLASEWKKMTGLPFVFAVWACRRDQKRKQELAVIAGKAWEKGKKNLLFLAQTYAQRLNLNEAICHDYLSSVIHYELSSRDMEAIRLFSSFLQACPRDLKNGGTEHPSPRHDPYNKTGSPPSPRLRRGTRISVQGI